MKNSTNCNKNHYVIFFIPFDNRNRLDCSIKTPRCKWGIVCSVYSCLMWFGMESMNLSNSDYWRNRALEFFFVLFIYLLVIFFLFACSVLTSFFSNGIEKVNLTSVQLVYGMFLVNWKIFLLGWFPRNTHLTLLLFSFFSLHTLLLQFFSRCVF